MKHLIFFLCLLPALGLPAQELRIKVLAGDFDRKDCPVSLDVSGEDFEWQNNRYQLFETKGNRRIPVPSQLDAGKPRLYFILKGETKRGESREYILRATAETYPETNMTVVKDRQGLKLMWQERPVLNYRFAEVDPPEGVSPLFKRSGFIHPLWSPGGEVLTRIQAPDHYHHYGIWGPWTKTKIEDREVDFWNLGEGKGTVRFSNFLTEAGGPVFSGFSVLQEHIDFGAKGADRTAINEMLEVTAWNTGNERVWLIDYTSTMNCPLDSGILLDAYRYGGGIGFRATEKWHRDNSSVLTSEGNTRQDADGTNARWCLLEGESVAGKSGILFMSHPSNRAFPEPMRVWPEDANGRGDVYFEFTPIRHQPWKLEHGRNYSQRYRMVVFDGELTRETAEEYWTAFARPPVVVADRNPGKTGRNNKD